MKKIVLLLIVSITLFGCGQDAIEEGMTPEEIEVIVAQAETSVESILSNAIEKDELVDPNDIANEIELLEGVVSAEASGSTILMNLTDGTELYYFFVDITDDKWFITNETKATQSEALKTKAITQTQTSDIIKPGGNGKALILAPFQFQLRTDLETISNILEDAGYITHPFINEDADIDIFRSSFLSIYDIVIIFTHGGSFEEDGKKNTMICTGEKVSRKRTKQLEADGQKGWNKGKAGGVSGTWYGITQEWLSETMPKDKFFHNTWVFVNGCETSVWDNLEGSLSKAFFDLGAEAYNGYKRIMYTSELQTASRFMIYNFCSGLSFMDAYEWTTNNFFSEKVLRLSDNEVSYVFDGLQKHASTPFYIVPPDGYQVLPSVNLSSIDNITGTTADCDCEVTSEGWRRVTARGVCWSTSENPTTSNSKTTDGEGPGPYTSNITGLSPNTTYYVRAYATNSEGTAYGEQKTFTTNAQQATPSVTSGDVTNITTTTASCSGNVTSDGGSSVTARGVCWSTSQNPTTSNSKTTNGTGVGTYTSHITGLSPNTTYYVRAYATNSQGTAYGEQRTFRTLTASDIEYGSFTDSRDGIVYKTVTIGEQVWMAENLAYLPSVVGPATESYTAPYYYVYGYDGTSVATAKATTNYQTYGVLYNWPAAMTACPSGWHLPSHEEWTQLETYLANNGHNYDGSLGGDNIRDKIAISLASATGWNSSTDTGAIGNTNTAYDAYRNKSGFSALPGGYRYGSGTFGYIGGDGGWWSSTESRTDHAWRRLLTYFGSSVYWYDTIEDYGYSVRCLRD